MAKKANYLDIPQGSMVQLLFTYGTFFKNVTTCRPLQ